MPELLLELLSEEIPARMQKKAAADLARLMTEKLKEAGLKFSPPRAFATPRRLALVIDDLPASTPNRREERRGPRVGAPDQAIDGFCAGAGVTRDQLEEREDKKGAFYYAVIEQKGRATSHILSRATLAILQEFPWPKSMRWGTGDLRWVRPLQSVLCLLGGQSVAFDMGDIAVGNTTISHRFLGAKEPFAVSGFADYKQKLFDNKVILDPADRMEAIRVEADGEAMRHGLTVVEDKALVEEVAGLVEWPVALIGGFDPAFLDLPEEVIQLTLKTNQKVFILRDKKTGRLAPNFVLIANMQAADGGKTITRGNEKVIAARLADAKFFYDQDRAQTLASRLPKLDAITFHEKLGTLHERVARIEALAVHIAETYVWPGLDSEARSSFDKLRTNGWWADLKSARPELVEGRADDAQTCYLGTVNTAARLAKADLVTAMVYEFPELQGVMGRYYAEAEGLPEPVANAIEQHYAPKGPEDACPTDPVAVCVALAEKIDTILEFFSIWELPTGSKDPFALRRAALGIIRIILGNSLRISLKEIALFNYRSLLTRVKSDQALSEVLWKDLARDLANKSEFSQLKRLLDRPKADEWYKSRLLSYDMASFGQFVDFLADRLKVQQREAGTRHDLIDAVFALGGEDDLVRLLARVRALQEFVETEDGANLLAGYKRAANILKKEEAKDDIDYAETEPHLTAAAEPAEKALYERLSGAAGEAKAAVEIEDFADAMAVLASLRAPIDTFFDEVTVNAPDKALRANRLALLARFRAAVHHVADFSKIEG